MTDYERKRAEFQAALQRYEDAEAGSPWVYVGIVVGGVAGVALAEFLMWATP